MEQNGQRKDYYSDLYELVDLLKAMKKYINRNIKFFFSFSLSFSHKIINIIGKNFSSVKQKLKFLYVYFIECVI